MTGGCTRVLFDVVGLAETAQRTQRPLTAFAASLEATFVPAKPARRSYLAQWRDGSDEGDTEVVLALPA